MSQEQWQCCAAGKVTVGLASHWPCITGVCGISTNELTGLREGEEVKRGHCIGLLTLLLKQLHQFANLWHSSGLYCVEHVCQLHFHPLLTTKWCHLVKDDSKVFPSLKQKAAFFAVLLPDFSRNVMKIDCTNIILSFKGMCLPLCCKTHLRRCYHCVY